MRLVTMYHVEYRGKEGWVLLCNPKERYEDIKEVNRQFKVKHFPVLTRIIVREVETE